MALNFPNNPQSGDQYSGPNGVTYTYDGVKWVGASVETGSGFPTASTTTAGVVKVDGTSITIANGVISSQGGGGGNPFNQSLNTTNNVTFNSIGTATVNVSQINGTNPGNELVIQANNHNWTFGTNGKLTLPVGGDILNSNGDSVLGGGAGSSSTLVNGDFVVGLQVNGSLLLPTGDYQENQSRYQGAILSENESSTIYMDVQTNSQNNVYGGMRLETWNSVPIDIRTRAGGQGDDIKNWRFDSDGNLTLPTNGTISYTPDDADNWDNPAVNTIQAALDELAAKVAALQNLEIDGGNANTPALGELLIDGNGA